MTPWERAEKACAYDGTQPIVEQVAEAICAAENEAWSAAIQAERERLKWAFCGCEILPTDRRPCNGCQKVYGT